jgi:hypothetical protein
MYVRGLFFAYNVVWESTFINDPEIIAGTLRYLLGTAAVLLNKNVPGAGDVTRLMTRDGDPAAPWIHLYALSAALFIVLPRSLLALASANRLRRAEGAVRLDLDDEYYVDLLHKARAVSPRELETGMRNAVREECHNMCKRLADFVCVALYDQRIASRLWRFRESGGTLNQLEKELARECQSFGDELEIESAKAERDLECRLAERLRRLLGEENRALRRGGEAFFGQIAAASSRSATHLGDRVSGELAMVVAGVVSTSIGLVLGTLSGGFGNALGIALLMGVVESGPVGWLIGAVGGLVATGTVFAVGQKKVRESIKGVPLPGALLKVALWRSRYERLIAEGRRRCEESIRESLAARIDELSSTIAEHLWSRLRVSVGEWQRPRAKRSDERA